MLTWFFVVVVVWFFFETGFHLRVYINLLVLKYSSHFMLYGQFQKPRTKGGGVISWFSKASLLCSLTAGPAHLLSRPLLWCHPYTASTHIKVRIARDGIVSLRITLIYRHIPRRGHHWILTFLEAVTNMLSNKESIGVSTTVIVKNL